MLRRFKRNSSRAGVDFNDKPSQEEENQKWNSSLFYLQLEGPSSSLTMLIVILEPICGTCNMTKTETPHGFEKYFHSWYKVGGASPPEKNTTESVSGPKFTTANAWSQQMNHWGWIIQRCACENSFLNSKELIDFWFLMPLNKCSMIRVKREKGKRHCWPQAELLLERSK